jgi:hypothetical protein
LLVLGTIAWAAGLYSVLHRQPAGAARSVTLSISGPGYKKSSLVQVHAGWEVRWAYDCPPSVGQGGFGIVGSFDAIVRSANGDEAFPQKDISNQGSAGQGRVSYPLGGSFYLEIQSQCNWEVQIVDAAAGGPFASPSPSG